MTIHSEVGLGTGTYTVTRPGVGSWVLGRFVRPAATTFPIEATEYPGSGTSDEDEEQGQETSETRMLSTDTQLFAPTPTPPSGGDTGVGREADLVTIDGAQWVVTNVKHYKIISGHYVVTVERLYAGDAT